MVVERCYRDPQNIFVKKKGGIVELVPPAHLNEEVRCAKDNLIGFQYVWWNMTGPRARSSTPVEYYIHFRLLANNLLEAKRNYASGTSTTHSKIPILSLGTWTDATNHRTLYPRSMKTFQAEEEDDDAHVEAIERFFKEHQFLPQEPDKLVEYQILNPKDFSYGPFGSFQEARHVYQELLDEDAVLTDDVDRLNSEFNEFGFTTRAIMKQRLKRRGPPPDQVVSEEEESEEDESRDADERPKNGTSVNVIQSLGYQQGAAASSSSASWDHQSSRGKGEGDGEHADDEDDDDVELDGAGDGDLTNGVVPDELRGSKLSTTERQQTLKNAVLQSVEAVQPPVIPSSARPLLLKRALGGTASGAENFAPSYAYGPVGAHFVIEGNSADLSSVAFSLPHDQEQENRSYATLGPMAPEMVTPLPSPGSPVILPPVDDAEFQEPDSSFQEEPQNIGDPQKDGLILALQEVESAAGSLSPLKDRLHAIRNPPYDEDLATHQAGLLMEAMHNIQEGQGILASGILALLSRPSPFPGAVLPVGTVNGPSPEAQLDGVVNPSRTVQFDGDKTATEDLEIIVKQEVFQNQLPAKSIDDCERFERFLSQNSNGANDKFYLWALRSMTENLGTGCERKHRIAAVRVFLKTILKEAVLLLHNTRVAKPNYRKPAEYFVTAEHIEAGAKDEEEKKFFLDYLASLKAQVEREQKEYDQVCPKPVLETYRHLIMAPVQEFIRRTDQDTHEDCSTCGVKKLWKQPFCLHNLKCEVTKVLNRVQDSVSKAVNDQAEPGDKERKERNKKLKDFKKKFDLAEMAAEESFYCDRESDDPQGQREPSPARPNSRKRRHSQISSSSPSDSNRQVSAASAGRHQSPSGGDGGRRTPVLTRSLSKSQQPSAPPIAVKSKPTAAQQQPRAPPTGVKSKPLAAANSKPANKKQRQVMK